MTAQDRDLWGQPAADRPLALSPDLSAAHLARGYLFQNADLNWRGAEAEFRRALELAPNYGAAKFYFGSQLAIYLTGLNRRGEADRAIQRAIELQPPGTARVAAYYGFAG